MQYTALPQAHPRPNLTASPAGWLKAGGWGLSSNTLLDTERRPEVVTPSGGLAVIRQTAGATMWTCTGARPVLRWRIDATTSRSPCTGLRSCARRSGTPAVLRWSGPADAPLRHDCRH